MARIAIDQRAVARFCEAHGIRELALFGSVLRDDFGPDSDIDVLMDVPPARAPSFFELYGMERELSAILGGRVDLVSQRGLSRHLRDRVMADREILYGPQG